MQPSIARCDFCNAVHVRCSASGFCVISKFVSELERLHGSEVTGKVNDSIVRNQCCIAEEILELRSRRGKFIYDRTYNSVGLNKVSHFSRRGRANSRLPMIEKNKIFVTENTESESFCMEGYSEKYTIVV